VSIASLADLHVRQWQAKLRSKPDDTTAVQAAPVKTPPAQQNPVTMALDVLSKYIPTDIVALYIAALSAGLGGKTLFWSFVAATPVLLLLTSLGDDYKTTGVIPPVTDFPYWKMISATIAFAAWAVAMPGSAWTTTGKEAAIAGFAARSCRLCWD